MRQIASLRVLLGLHAQLPLSLFGFKLEPGVVGRCVSGQ